MFIGLGFPYEGPAPLEAIANGCFFLNPRINPPINRGNSKFLKGKPTLRSLTSQNPYTEMFIGQPYVYTVDVENREEVNDALMKMASLPVSCLCVYGTGCSGCAQIVEILFGLLVWYVGFMFGFHYWLRRFPLPPSLQIRIPLPTCPMSSPTKVCWRE